MAVERVLGGKMIWYSEFEKHPSTLLSARFPGVPNIGDLTKVDWASLPEIDILTGGYPCQPFSQAGKRLGENDPRHLWPHIREAVRVLRPRITILENVAGHRSKGFSTVLRDCAEDGLHVRWVSVRASDAGAPHKRDRIFLPLPTPLSRDYKGRSFNANDMSRLVNVAVKLLPTRRTTDSQGSGKHGDGGMDLRTTMASLGESTSQPSGDGKACLGAPHLTRLSRTKTDDHV
ncbi:DNA cytosine methyltransferase [Mycobacterium intracellulare]|nr:DNA cytosine methyltransferase [Mycobacterium intracellulare]